MKRNWLVIIFLFGFINVNAQQLPQYTQYIFNQLLINPAVSGIENYTDVKTGYRSQWTGLQGAPVTTYFTITAPIGKAFVQGDILQVPSDGNDPAGRSYTRTYRAAEPHHGIGFTMSTDKAGPIRQTNIDATYAYHLGITSDLNLSAGVSAGFTNTILNNDEVTLGDQLDPAIYAGNNNQYKPDVNVGLWAYSSNYFIGASVRQILPQNINFSNSPAYNQGKTVPHYYLTGGVKIFLSDDVTFLPSIMYKIVNPVPNTLDINVKMGFRDHFWIGGSYRQDDAISGMMGFSIGSFLSLGYSYDYSTSNLNTVSTGTHEIVVGIYLNNKYSVSGPQHSF